MIISFAKTTETNEIAEFIGKLNKQKKTHIGFVGTDFDEIVATIKEDFVLENNQLAFGLLRNDVDELIATIGFDMYENTVEVWGPFGVSISEEALKTLWQSMLNHFPHIDTTHFFVHVENTAQQKFIERLQAKKTGEHVTLTVSKADFVPLNSQKSVPFQMEDEKIFERLHNAQFPNTYYDAKTIISRLNDDRRLLLLKNEQQELQGYAYFEVASIFGEANLEYIAISPKHQNRGLGTLLLQEVIQEIFKYDNISEIKLCVNNNNDRANHVYLKVGFKKEDILISYTFHQS